MDWSFEVLKYQFLSRQLLCVRILFLASLWCAASRFFWNTSFTDDVQHNWNVLLFWVLAVVFLSWFWNCPIPTFSCMFYFPSFILLFVKKQLWGDMINTSLLFLPSHMAFGTCVKLLIVVKHLQISLRGEPLPLDWKHFSCLQLALQIGIVSHSTL